MPRARPFVLALLSGAALVWTLPAFAVYPGSCANGKTLYNKTNPATGVGTSCSNGSCHTSDPTRNANHIQNGSGNPADINYALDGTPTNQQMSVLDLRNNLPLSAQDIDDLATWIFYAPTCPSASPILQAAPAPVVFGSTTVGSTSASIAVTVTNVGTADATSVSLTNSNATEFIVSGSTCTGTIVASGGTCSFSVAFKPSTSGSRSGSVVVNRSGGAGVTIGVSGTGASGGTSGKGATVTVVEYHHAIFDHYFITPAATDIALLDARAPPFQDWSRTGFTFNVYVNATAPAGSVAICRFFNDHFAPKSSHFYGPRGGSCDQTLALFPDWVLEDDKFFNAMLPDGSGNCPAGTIPVYRLYNQGMGGAPNHRFVTSLVERQNMVNQGFAAEGVGMCAPP